MKNKIALIGYRGTGKTTLGLKLKNMLNNYLFIDLDEYIVNKEKKSIPEIFSQSGEQYFRKLENKYLKEITDNYNKIILSTGGGIILSEENRNILKTKYINILLTASTDEIYKRISGDKNRPALSSKDQYVDIVQNLRKRNKFYNDVANITIKTDKNNIKQSLDIIKKNLTLPE